MIKLQFKLPQALISRLVGTVVVHPEMLSMLHTVSIVVNKELVQQLPGSLVWLIISRTSKIKFRHVRL